MIFYNSFLGLGPEVSKNGNASTRLSVLKQLLPIEQSKTHWAEKWIEHHTKYSERSINFLESSNLAASATLLNNSSIRAFAVESYKEFFDAKYADLVHRGIKRSHILALKSDVPLKSMREAAKSMIAHAAGLWRLLTRDIERKQIMMGYAVFDYVFLWMLKLYKAANEKTVLSLQKEIKILIFDAEPTLKTDGDLDAFIDYIVRLVTPLKEKLDKFRVLDRIPALPGLGVTSYNLVPGQNFLHFVISEPYSWKNLN